MGVRIERLQQPLEPITLDPVRDAAGNVIGGGRDAPARDFTLGMYKLEARAYQGDEAAAMELLRLCLPDLTDVEADSLTPENVFWVFSYCGRKLKEVSDALKNAERAAGADPSSPSAPTTSSNTPSPASPAPSGRTGSRKPTSRSGKPSSLSIG